MTTKTGVSYEYHSVSRHGKKAITTYLDPKVYRQFKILAVERELSGEALIYEALNDVFKKYDKPQIATRGKQDA
jgi:predicted DNA-binding ribbon-helix-helix protein